MQIVYSAMRLVFVYHVPEKLSKTELSSAQTARNSSVNVRKGTSFIDLTRSVGLFQNLHLKY